MPRPRTKPRAAGRTEAEAATTTEDRPMGFTLEEAEALGLGREHPDHPSRRPRMPKPTGKNALGQNKTEAKFDRLLEDMKRDGRIRDFRFEPVRIRLAGNTFYRIDFLVLRLDRTVAAVEVKGFMRDDAAVKLKVAPEVCPFFDYFVAFSGKDGWDIRRVDRRGIGRLHEADWFVTMT